MVVNRVWIWISLAAAVLMAASSAAGVFRAATYARETASWGAQGLGQDVANLFAVFPAMLIALHFVHRGSVRATLVWLGLLVYIVYSYVLYAFFVHFGPLFPVYVAVLGLSSYALFGSVLHIDRPEALRLLTGIRAAKLASTLLLIFGLLFAALWLSQIVKALLSGTTPEGVAEIGLPVNPVHVLDLAFIVPGMIVTAIALRRRSALGLLFAVPLLTFSAVMSLALVAMFYTLRARGFPVSTVPVILMALIAATSVYAAARFLRDIEP